MEAMPEAEAEAEQVAAEAEAEAEPEGESRAMCARKARESPLFGLGGDRGSPALSALPPSRASSELEVPPPPPVGSYFADDS